MQREALLRRTGIVQNSGAWYGPGSAAHQAVKDGPLRCVRGTEENRKIFAHRYARLFRRAYAARVLSNEGRFLEAAFRRTERKLAGPGRPGAVDGLMGKGGA